MPLHNLATSSDDRAHLALRNINHVVPAVHASVAVLAQQRCDRRTSCSDRVRLPNHSKRVPATHRVDLHVVLRFQITHRCAALANHCAHTTVRNRYLRTLRLQQCRNRITASSNAVVVAKHNNALAAAHSLHAHTVLLLKPLHNLATSSDDRAHLALRNINHVVPAVHASVAVLAQQRCDRRTSCSDRVRLPNHSKRVPATHRVDLHVVLRFQITHRCAALANHCAHTTVRNRYLRTLRLQ